MIVAGAEMMRMPAIEKSRLLWDNSGHLLISGPEPWPRRVTLQMKQATNTALSADRAAVTSGHRSH